MATGTGTNPHSFSAAGSIREAGRDDLEAIRNLFREANEVPYDLALVAEEKCFGAGVKGPPETLLAVDHDAMIQGVVVTCGDAIRILAVRRTARRLGIGSALLAAAEERLQGTRLVIGAEAGNYFTPGVLDRDEETLRFFTHRGYQRSGETDNLSVDVTPAELTPPAAATLPPAATPPAVELLGRPYRASHARRSEVLSWIEREFGAIWRFESEPSFDRDEVSMFLVDSDGSIAGFAAHDANNRGLGFFGPTGVSSKLRGRGLGRLLLLASLADLRARGFSRVVIPWTDALEFYRKSCGAVPEHHFIQLTRLRR